MKPGPKARTKDVLLFEKRREHPAIGARPVNLVWLSSRGWIPNGRYLDVVCGNSASAQQQEHIYVHVNITILILIYFVWVFNG